MTKPPFQVLRPKALELLLTSLALPLKYIQNLTTSHPSPPIHILVQTPRFLQHPPNWSPWATLTALQSTLNKAPATVLKQRMSLLSSNPPKGLQPHQVKPHFQSLMRWTPQTSPPPPYLILFLCPRPLTSPLSFPGTRNIPSTWNALLQVSTWFASSPPSSLCPYVTLSVRHSVNHPL